MLPVTPLVLHNHAETVNPVAFINALGAPDVPNFALDPLNEKYPLAFQDILLPVKLIPLGYLFFVAK